MKAVRLAQYLFLAISVSALGYCVFVMLSAWLFQRQESKNLDLAIHRDLAGPKTDVPRALREPLKDGEVVGRLQIPRLGVKVIVVEGADDRDLRLGAGHIPGTVLPDEHGNVGIAGHRDTIFRPLKNIRQNDTIQVTTPQGEYTYRVLSTATVDPGDVGVLKPTGVDTLTLVTCYPFYFIGHAPKRFIVRAART